MQLRDTRLLLVILGMSNSNLQRAAGHTPDLYSRASSSEGLLCIRKYWDSHCSTFSKLPILALVNPGSCPRGLEPALFLQLLSRLTDLQQWQIWDLWTSLDIHSCGFVGCAEFSLLVVLLCAGVAQQQLAAVHAYASSICRTFLGAHVGDSASGLCKCCLLMGLPASALFKALKQQQQQQLPQQTKQQKQLPQHTKQQEQQQQHCCGSKCGTVVPASQSMLQANAGSAGCCNEQGPCSCSGSSLIKPSSADGSSSSSSSTMNSIRQKQIQDKESRGAAGALGCCCQQGDGQPQQWACGAAAHRQHCSTVAAMPGGLHKPGKLPADTLMTADEVELVLYKVATQQARRQEGSATDGIVAERMSPGCWGACVIC